jgi:HAD superfamily hydrolase (TIGR01490 family)
MQHIAAIFDLDDTLLDESSNRLLFQYLRHNGQLSRYFRLRDSWTIATAILAYRMGMRDVTQVMQSSARIARGIALDEFWQLVQCWFDEIVVAHITPLGQERLAWHRAQGHLPVICSASSQFTVQPVAHHLGIEHMVYTEWLGQDGYMTGEIRRPIAYGAGKVYWMQQWAAIQHVSLAQSYFYTDHISDLPLLEAVGHPIAVNPDRKLAQLAVGRSWPIVDWR